MAFVGGNGASEHRAHVHHAEAAERAQGRRDQVIARHAQKGRAYPGRHALSPGRAGLRVGGGRRTRNINTRSKATISTSSTVGAAVAGQAATRAPVDRREHATSRTAARGQLVIDRDTASRLGITPQTDRRHALRRVRPAAGLDDVHAAQPVSRRDGSEPQFWQNPESLSNIYVQHQPGQASAAQHASPTTNPARPARGQPSGAISRRSRFRSISRPACRWARR